MIMDTMLMMISLRMLKKSHIVLPLSPMRPMQIPNVMKKPIKPGGGNTRNMQTGNTRNIQGMPRFDNRKQETSMQRNMQT